MNATLYIWQPSLNSWAWSIFSHDLPTQFFGWSTTAADCESQARQRCPFALRVLFTSPGETMSREVA